MNSDEFPFSDEQLETLKKRKLWVERGTDRCNGWYFKQVEKGRQRIKWKMRYLSDCLVPPDRSIGKPGIFSKEKKWKLYKREGDQDRLMGVSGWDESIKYILDHTPVSDQIDLF